MNTNTCYCELTDHHSSFSDNALGIHSWSSFHLFTLTQTDPTKQAGNGQGRLFRITPMLFHLPPLNCLQMLTHPDSIKWERKEPSTLPLYHTHSNQGWLLWAFYWCVALAQDTGNRQESGPLWTLLSKTKTFLSADWNPQERRSMLSMRKHHQETEGICWWGALNAAQEITQCKHAWGYPITTDGASQQWLQDFVDMSEPAAHSAEPTTPTQEETGYIRLPYNMNCHSYTEVASGTNTSNASSKKWWFRAGLLTKRLPSPCQNQGRSSINDIQFPPGSLSCLNYFSYQKGWQASKALFSAGALNDCLQLWTLSWSCHPTGYKASSPYQPPTFQTHEKLVH